MADRTRTLVTGYGPFGKIKDNPSAHLAQDCGRPHEVLEVSFEAAERFINELNPDSFDRLLMIGVADGRDFITPELYARNQIGRTKDVHGHDRFGPIDPHAPLLLVSSLWHPKSIASLFPEDRVRASCDAGRYLCNYISYRAMARFPDKRVGFLHVPDATEMPLDEQAEVLQRVLAAVETGTP
jgi:pyroglutamyl-peptidase